MFELLSNRPAQRLEALRNILNAKFIFCCNVDFAPVHRFKGGILCKIERIANTASPDFTEA